MEKKEQKHLYADTVEQNKRANHFLAIGYIVFYLCVLCVVGLPASEESAQLDIPL